MLDALEGGLPAIDYEDLDETWRQFVATLMPRVNRQDPWVHIMATDHEWQRRARLEFMMHPHSDPVRTEILLTMLFRILELAISGEDPEKFHPMWLGSTERRLGFGFGVGIKMPGRCRVPYDYYRQSNIWWTV